MTTRIIKPIYLNWRFLTANDWALFSRLRVAADEADILYPCPTASTDTASPHFRDQWFNLFLYADLLGLIDHRGLPNATKRDILDSLILDI